METCRKHGKVYISKLDELAFSFLMINKNTLWPLFIDGVQLAQGYRSIRRRQLTIYHLVPKNSWYSFDQATQWF